MTVTRIKTTNVYVVATEGSRLGSEQDALDLIGETYGNEVDMVAVPVARLHDDFLRLRTGMAGGFLQKMVNYGMRVAIVGDISTAVDASKSLQDFVRESNMGTQVYFASSMDDLADRL